MKWTGLRLQGSVLMLGVILAILIWVFSRRFAAWIWRGEPEAPQDSPFAAGVLQIELFSATGLVLIGLALPGLVREAVEYWTTMTGRVSLEYSGTRAIGLTVQLLFGLWLFLRPGFFAGFLPRRKNLGEKSRDG